ncbi:tyrosine--tRNA ligase, mitochondrial [[Candida] jaroonii]|uniref:Tyrosine--tRNA ligase, mitochondrial n=1 Tax=[Candida] jaroonii TaxID=467808 RepID=A0ACA9Y8R4_9ASCO|nr:tyrosine--tRNA ligase, mitochondrial [[Candida] jaroonii]
MLRHLTRMPSGKPGALMRRFQSSITEGDTKIPETITIVPKIESLTEQQSYDPDFQVSLVGHLQSRYLVESITNDDLYKLTAEESNAKFKLYCGADPTAKSLHLGNLLPLMILLHFNLRGHDIVTLVGGATGAVGDPSGRTTERSQMEEKERLDNVENIQNQMTTFISRGIEYARSRNYPIKNLGQSESLNNNSWWKDIKMLDFLATYGKHIRVSAMLGRDSIQSRLESQSGLGFNEFTYQILQAYDFWHMFKNNKVNMQIGGNDQWGNITAGVDLISRLQKSSKTNKKDTDLPSYGMTVPLLTTPSGAKFGKSAGNAIFISEQATSPYQLYQYFINVPDEMVSKLLKCFTLLPISTIDNIVMAQHKEDPAYRIAQRVLAREVTDLVHGVGVGDEMAYITSFLFPTPDQPFNESLSADKLLRAFRKSGILSKFSCNELQYDELKLSTLLAKVMNKSRTETKNLIKSGGMYIGIERNQIDDPDDLLLFDRDYLLEDKLLLIRTGKQKYHVVEFTD